MGSLVDKHGRTITAVEVGPDTVYSIEGLTVTFPSDIPTERVLLTFDAMAPPAPPETHSTPVVPDEVSMWQLRVMLHRRGKLAAADALATQVGGEITIAWENAAIVSRASPGLNLLAPQLGLSQEDIDAMFIEAASIVA